MPGPSPPPHLSQAPHPMSGSPGSAISTPPAPAADSTLDYDVYVSEKETGSRNRAIAYMLQSFGVLDGDPDDTLDVYYRQCSIKVTSTDLSRMAATLARGGINPMTGRKVIDTGVVQAHSQRDGDLRNVRRRRRLGQCCRHACKEWRGWWHRRRPARPARNRCLLTAIGRKGQQCSRSSGMPQPF